MLIINDVGLGQLSLFKSAQLLQQVEIRNTFNKEILWNVGNECKKTRIKGPYSKNGFKNIQTKSETPLSW